MPPPDTTLRRRSGYRAIDTEDLAQTASTDEPGNHQEASAEDDFDEREVVQREGWEDLLMSFLASGAMTVCSAFFSLYSTHVHLQSLPRTFSRLSSRSRYSGST